MKFLDKINYNKFGWYFAISFVVAFVLQIVQMNIQEIFSIIPTAIVPFAMTVIVLANGLVSLLIIYFLIGWIIFKIPFIKNNQTVSRWVGTIMLVLLLVSVVGIGLSILIAVAN